MLSQDCDHDKQSIFVIIYDTDSPQLLTKPLMYWLLNRFVSIISKGIITSTSFRVHIVYKIWPNETVYYMYCYA